MQACRLGEHHSGFCHHCLPSAVAGLQRRAAALQHEGPVQLVTEVRGALSLLPDAPCVDSVRPSSRAVLCVKQMRHEHHGLPKWAIVDMMCGFFCVPTGRARLPARQ